MNTSGITEITLLGFGNLQDLRYFIFLLFLVVYLMTVIGNMIIIFLVSTNNCLQSPMFFFLGHLSFSDMLVASSIVPCTLNVIILEGGVLSLTGCFTQFFFYGASAAAECLLLTVMSYDRYLAICKPLHYTTIMDLKLCLHLAAFSWSLGFAITLIPTSLMQSLWFCGPNVIDHFFCELEPLLELSCSDVSKVKYELFTFASLLTIMPFLFITVTYVYIFLTILRITLVTGRQKTISTCSSHLTVVCIYYGALFFLYVIPSKGASLGMKKMASVMYTVVTPLLNPVIYSLRNQEMKSALMKYLSTCKKNYIS